jgi:hypothetical protein
MRPIALTGDRLAEWQIVASYLQDIYKFLTDDGRDASTPANAQRCANSNAAPIRASGCSPAALGDDADAQQLIGFRPRNVYHLPAAI